MAISIGLVVAAAVAVGYSVTKQFVIEGTTLANYQQWETRPMFLWSIGALVTALVVLAIDRLGRGPWLFFVAVALVGLSGAGVARYFRAHPDGHERSIASQLVLPAGYRRSSYQPTQVVSDLDEQEPPSLVVTWSATVSAPAACAELGREIASWRSLRIPLRRGVAISPGVGGVGCSWVGSVGGWPVVAEVDEPSRSPGYEVPGRSYGAMPAPVAAGTVRVDLWVQPPDG
jgi:hypothetical protein